MKIPSISWCAMELAEHGNVEKYSGLTGLESIAENWKQIRQQITRPSFYHLFGWYWGYTKYLDGSGESISYYVIRANNDPVAIVPVKRYERKLFGIPVLSLETPDHNHLGLTDLILAEESGFSAYAAIQNVLESEGKRREVDVFRVMESCEDSILNKYIEQQDAYRVIRTQVTKSKYIDCRVSYEVYLDKLTGRFKKNNRRKRRKAEKLGELEFDILDAQQDFDKKYETFLDLEASGWKGEKGRATAIKQHEDLHQFYGSLKAKLQGEAEVIINSLELDGKCIAAQYCIVVAGTVYLLKIAFDENYSEVSPGFLLLDELIRVVCENSKLDRISFVTGASWNDDWMPETLVVNELIIVNHTFRGRLVFLAYRVKTALKKILNVVRR